jgi:hypothetical protein
MAVYDPSVMDQQLGAMAVLRMLMDLDSDVVFAALRPRRSGPFRPRRSAQWTHQQRQQSPRADDTETNVKPLGKSKTIWSSIVQWVTSNTAIVFGFIDKHPEIVIGFLG